MSNFAVVCVTRSGSYYFYEYLCKTFGLVEGSEWFGRNKSVNLTNPIALTTKPVDIDWTVNEDLLTSKDIKRRIKHLENFPFPYCIKVMPLQLSNTPTQTKGNLFKRAEIACNILEDFDLIWFNREDKISNFCFELTAMHCSQPGFPRNREYCTYDPLKRTNPPPNSFTATKEQWDRFTIREEFTNWVMLHFPETPKISYEEFVEDQDTVLDTIQEHYGIKANYNEENKKEILKNPDYTEIFTNYNDIEQWSRLKE